MEKVKLGDVCEIINGYAFKSNLYEENGIRIIRITNVQKGYIEDTEPKFYNLNLKRELNKYMLYEKDLLISLTGNVGRVGILKKEMLPAALNQRVGCIRVLNKSRLDKNYLFNVLNNKLFENECINNSKGIAQKNLSTEWLKEYKINLPSLEEQKNIANKLDKVQKIIDIRKKQIEELDELIKSQFVEMFGDPYFNQYNWKIGTIRELVSDVRYGTSKPSTEGGKYKYLRMNNITYNGKLDVTDIKYIDIPDNEIEKCSTKKGDILFNRTNSRELVGKTCVFDLDEKMVIAGFVIRLRVNELSNPYFLSEYLNTKYMKKNLYNMCKNASGQSNINAQELQNIKIYIPPIELQNQFADIVKQIDKQKFEIQKNLEEMQKLQESLMNKYFG